MADKINLGHASSMGSVKQSFDGVLPEAHASDVITSNWTNLFPSLYSVSAISSTEAWASGEYGHLIHYANGSWSTVDPPNLRGYELWDIKMLSATSGWMAAETNAFHYDGTSWQDASNGLSTIGWIERIAPVANNDVWGIGPNTIEHWDGSRWSTAGPPISDTVSLNDIVMSGPNDGWLAGEDGSGKSTSPYLLHYDGTNWTRIPPPPYAAYFKRISDVSPSEVWFVGSDGYFGQIYRYRNGTWDSWYSPDESDFYTIFMLNSSEGWASTGESSLLRWNGTDWGIEQTGSRGDAPQSISGVVGPNGAQVWAAGGPDAILSYSGSTESKADGAGKAGKDSPDSGPWVKESGGPTGNDLFGVSALSPHEAWAVGDKGTFLHYTDASGWQAVSSTITGTLTAVQMLSTTEGYAVGTNVDNGLGIIAQWDGSNWTQVAAPVLAGFNALSMTGSRNGWAVGSAIWHDNNGVWAPVQSPTARQLYGVAFDSPSHGWAVGDGPTLLEYTNGNWVDRSGSLPAGSPQLRSIALQPGGSQGWAVGINTSGSLHTILHLLNGVWTIDPVTTGGDALKSVAPEALDEAWAVGCGATGAYHYIGGRWQSEQVPEWGVCLSGISLIPGQGGWAVSYSGKIFKYNPLTPGQHFYDVPPSNVFYNYIECMVQHGVISGYADNTFRPGNNVTRGQLAKIISNSAGLTGDPGPPQYQDVPLGSTFYDYINRLSSHGAMSGYPCGGTNEPCVPPGNLPYFRPNNNATRGQISKIVSNAAGFSDPPSGQQFQDVPAGSTYYTYTYRLVSRTVMSGYACGGAGEPCIPPGDLPYFRPNNNATRGQTSKIVANTFFPDCNLSKPVGGSAH